MKELAIAFGVIIAFFIHNLEIDVVSEIVYALAWIGLSFIIIRRSKNVWGRSK